MNYRLLWLLGLAMAGVVCCSAVIEPKASSYKTIVARNAFALRKPPPEPPPPTNPPAQVNIIFTGITKTEGFKKAFFQLPVEGKPNEFNYPMLGEGDPFGNLKVLSIDETADSVQVDNAGQIMTLTFKTHGPKKAGPGAAGVAATGAIAPSAGGLMPGAMPPGGVVPGGAIPPPRPANAMPPATAFNQGQFGQPANNTMTLGSAAANMQPLPSRIVRTLPPAPAITHEESIVNMEIQRALNAEKIAAGTMPPLPPTVLSNPEMDAGTPVINIKGSR